MHTTIRKLLLIMVPVAVLMSHPPTAAVAEEWEKYSPYYEDDAWYDVTEWLDGNDYNPTDEKWWKWDDEQYNWAAVEKDRDNDTYAGYGYDGTNRDDDWYYDYYDATPYSDYDGSVGDGSYRYYYSYFDTNRDGYYDAYSSSHDADGDGIYDEFSYFAFNVNTRNDATKEDARKKDLADSSTKKSTTSQQANQQTQSAPKKIRLTGTVEHVKQLKVRNGEDRLIAQIEPQANSQVSIIDLGPANQLGQSREKTDGKAKEASRTIQQGEQITASGPVIKVGDKQVLVAHEVKIGNQKEQQIRRTGHTLDGKILKLKTAKSAGQNHQLAILSLESGKQAVVDLGNAEKLQAGLQVNEQIQVTGVPVKVDGRSLILAQSITQNGKTTQIQRTTRKASASREEPAEKADRKE